MKAKNLKSKAKNFIKDNKVELCLLGVACVIGGAYGVHVYNCGMKDGAVFGAAATVRLLDLNYEDLNAEEKLVELVKKYPDITMKIK